MRAIHVLFSCTSTLLGISAQAPRLLLDVNATAEVGHSNPQGFVQVGANTFFTARTVADGRELWRTDGSPVGTLRLTDLGPGPSEGALRELRSTGSRLLFAVGESGRAQELWASDGSATGTHRVRGFAGPIWIAAGARNGVNLVFTTDELWLSDGTANGTRFVQALGAPGAEVGRAAVLGNHWFFVRGGHVWQTDGTIAGARYLGSSRNRHASPVVVGPHAYWIGDDGVRRSDGRSNELVAPTAAFIQDLAGVGGKVVYVPGTELWSFDVANPQPRIVSSRLRTDGRLTPVGSQVFLVAEDAATGRELWVTDGTDVGTRMVYDSVPGPGSPSHDGLVPFANSLLHSTSTATSAEVWVVPAGAGSPQLLRRFALPGIDSLVVAQPGSRAYFAADDGVSGHEVWTTDGTVGGTRLALDLVPGSVTASSMPYGYSGSPAGIFFSAADARHGRELWITDGTPAGTRLVADVEPGALSSNPEIIGWHAGVLYFVAGALPRAQVWTSDGTAAGTRQLLPLPFGARARGRLRALDSQRALLQLDPDLGVPAVWVTDGRTATQLGEVNPVADMVRVGQRAFFAGRASASEYELTVTDGTPAGTRTVIDLNGGEDSRVFPFAALREEVLFAAQHNGGRGLYASDGTAAGTRLVFDFSSWSVVFVSGLTVGDRVFLVASTDAAFALWVTDGTAAGTRPLADLEGRQASPSLQELDGRVLVATDRGLWRSDGTVLGTVRLRDGESLFGAAASDGRYAYWLSSSPSGVLRSDGTAAGTSLLSTGPVSANCGLVGARLVFTNDDVLHGAEPWVFDVGAAASSLGLGCGPRALLPTLRGSAPVLGSVALLQGDGLPSLGVALLRFTVPLAQPVVLAGIGCLSWGDANGPMALWTRSFGNGQFAELLAVPQAPHLIGAPIVVDAILASAAGLELTNAVHWTLDR